MYMSKSNEYIKKPTNQYVYIYIHIYIYLFLFLLIYISNCKIAQHGVVHHNITYESFVWAHTYTHSIVSSRRNLRCEVETFFATKEHT